MKLMIATQVHENYGSEESPHWKAKGGDDYFVPVSMDALCASENKAEFMKELVDAARAVIEHDGSGYTESVIHYGLEDDDFLTDYEKSQLEYETTCSYPSKPVHVENGIAMLAPVYMFLRS